MKGARLGLRLTVSAVGVAALLAGCTSSGSSPGPSAPSGAAGDTGSTSSPAPSSASSPSASKTPTSASASATGTAAATDLKDGRYPAYVVKVDATKHRVTFDVIQFFTGKAAATAAAGDHSAEVPPPNDYWIRNTSTKVRTLPVLPAAPVTVNVLSAEESGDATKDTSVTLARLATYPTLKDAMFWVTVKDGVVTKVAEQFLP